MRNLWAHILIVGMALAVSTSSDRAAGGVLFQDNFDVADNTSFDAADTTGRLSGAVAGDVVLRAHTAQQQISGNQLLGIPTGGVRFENSAGSFGATNRYDWAAGAASAEILAAGGLSVSFDWTPPNNTSTDWVAWAIGTLNADSGDSIVNYAENDYGILFRNNGDTERFINGANQGAAGSFATIDGGATTYQVQIDYGFTSFADGSDVTAISYVDGVQVASDAFAWNNNGGALYMEFATNGSDNLVDNLRVFTVPEPSTVVLLYLSLVGLALRRRR